MARVLRQVLGHADHLGGRSRPGPGRTGSGTARPPSGTRGRLHPDRADEAPPELGYWATTSPRPAPTAGQGGLA